MRRLQNYATLVPYANEKVANPSNWPRVIQNYLLIFGLIFGAQNVWRPLLTRLPKANNQTLAFPSGAIVGDGGMPITAPINPTAQPTDTPIPPTPEVIPTPTEVRWSDVTKVGYSYYNPALGGINCHSANWDGSACRDTTASGIKWSEYMYHAVAIPPEWLSTIWYGSTITVISPEILAGRYVVIDICQACSSNIWPDGMSRLDFLDDTQRLPWAYPVEFYLSSVVTPVEAIP